MKKKLFHIAATRSTVHSEIDDEMRFHLDARTEELVRAGRTPDEARRIALEEYGDVAAARAELAVIDKRRVGRVALRESLASIVQDIRFAARSLAARPGFAATILLTLAIGIGANAAIFSVVDSMLLRPLPYAEPQRLVHLWETYGSSSANRSEASYPDYRDIAARVRSFSAVGGYHGGSFILGGDQPATIAGAKSTANFFDVLGVRPVVGRSFAAGEDAVGAPRVVLFSYGFWQRRFSGDRAIVGKSITLNGAAATVIGVLPESFQLARQSTADIWVPIDRGTTQREQRGGHWLNVVARLAPSATPASAERELSSLMRELRDQYPQSNAGRDGLVIPLQEEFVGSVKPILLLVYGAVIVVLLIACVNVANLLLIRGADRQREIAVRVALGAGQGRLVRQLLTESVLLSLVAAGLGLGIAALALKGLVALLPSQPIRGIPPVTSAGLDARIILYSIGVAVAAGLAFGAAPIPGLLRGQVHDTLKSGGRGSSGAARRVRETLVAAEIALTVILLSGAFLFGRSVIRLLSMDTGFRSERLVTASVVFPASRYSNDTSLADAYRRLEQNAHEIAGVEALGLVSKLPLDIGNSLGFSIVGQPAPDPAHRPEASYRSVSVDYFRTMAIPVVTGRSFNTGDDLKAPTVAVVNRALVKMYFSDRDPIGQYLSNGVDSIGIVGVVGDVPIGKLEDRIPPTMYFPLAQVPSTTMYVAARTSADPSQIAQSLRQALSGVDPSAALSTPRIMDDVITESPSVFLRRFPLYIIGAFALTALLLAVVGIYGVVSYSVTQRTREMGIRTALGAQPGMLIQLVMGQGIRLAAGGIVLGTIGALLVGRTADKLLYGVRATDPLTYAVVAVSLGLIAVAATILPARRATRIDPASALRAD